MNSVYIDSAVAASPIYIGPTNASSIIIGNTNSTTTIQGLPIKNTIGTPLVAYNISTASNASIPTGIEFGSTVINNTNQGGVALIDFHTNQRGFVDYDARISATGGSTGTPATTQGSLNYYAASHYFAGNVNMGTGSNIGLQPSSGYVAPTTGQLGSILSATSIASSWGGSAANAAITYTPGIWIGTFSIVFTSTTGSNNYLFLTTSDGILRKYGLSQATAVSPVGWTASGSYINSGTGNTVSLAVYANATTVDTTASFHTAVRIA